MCLFAIVGGPRSTVSLCVTFTTECFPNSGFRVDTQRSTLSKDIPGIFLGPGYICKLHKASTREKVEPNKIVHGRKYISQAREQA